MLVFVLACYISSCCACFIFVVLYFTCILFLLFAVTVCKCHIEIKGYLLILKTGEIDAVWISGC